ncbi:MAG: hypothetical protein ROO70_10575 [Labrenzia sp.]
MTEENGQEQMENRFQELLQSVNGILLDTPLEAKQLLTTYSRFEHALKQRPRPNSNESQTYARDNNGRVDILLVPYVDEQVANDFWQRMTAMPLEGYLVQHPPRRWTVDQGWQNAEAVVDNRTLFRAVRQVRNNMFHGAKFRMLLSGDQDRDINLLKAASLILLRAANEDAGLRRYFLY